MNASLSEWTVDIGFLRGGGAMGEYIRAYDWASTALGAPEQWSLPMRTATRILLTTNHPVFLFLGPQLLCLYNDAYARSLGPEKHPAILGMPARIAWDEIWPIIGPQVDLVMSGRGSTWHENHLVPIIRHGRREDVYWTYSYSPIDDPNAPHGVGGVLVLCTETTEQVLASERMRAAEERWRQLFEQAPGFMCVLKGPDHVFEFANPAYFALSGSDRHILGQSVAQAMPWTVEQGFLDILDSAYVSGIPYIAHAAAMDVPRADGLPAERRYIDFVYQPIREVGGTISGIFVLGSDVTTRQLTQEALRNSEDQLRVACDAASMGIHDYDIVNDRVTWDARIRELWGVDADEAVTYAVFEAGLHPDDRKPTRDRVERAFDPDGDHHFLAEYRVRHRGDGIERWVQATGRVAFSGRRAMRLVGTVLDITERKLAENRRLEFLATLGHELRNPLAPIVTSVSLLRTLQTQNETSSKAHEVIERQLRQITRLLEDLLDLVRISNGRIELRKETVSIDSILRAALETATPHIERGEFRVETHFAAEAPLMVLADPVRLAQVFSNLLINACKYSEPGKRIDLCVEKAQFGFVTVSVTDQGIGIERHNLKRVFEMFSQVEHSLDRAQGGLGVGLSLAKRLIESHGGTISADSRGKGHGSVFTVRLPLAEATDAGASARANTNLRHLRGLRVLVVDDNEDAAMSLSNLLENDGAVVAVATDGNAALAMAESFAPHAILLDIGLPGINGYEVCQTLRTRDTGQRIRIVALTGWGQSVDRARSKAAGFDRHLVKPATYEATVAAICDEIDRADA